jgi:DNA mismatch endonuclease (patch repair protein)
MQRVRSRDTAPEVALRRELHRLGLRYRVDVPVLPGSRRRADIVFGPTRVAIYVDGCFWHSCPEHGSAPRANSAWWAAKLQDNRRRDQETDALLTEVGWLVVRVWEHEDAPTVAAAIRQAVHDRRPTRLGTRLSHPGLAADEQGGA